MEKRTSTVSDFPVDTNGHCFICLSKVLPHDNSHESGSVSAQSYSSLHSLSQYLKMDMTKVFHEKESIPFELLNSVQSSRLKVSLCEQCTGWNDKITSLCRKLEKVKTEVSFYLEFIRESLVGSKDDDQTCVISKLGENHNLNGNLLEKVRIIKALRTEAKERCSQKLNTVRPRVQVHNLTPNQVISIEQKIKSNSKSQLRMTLDSDGLGGVEDEFIDFARNFSEVNQMKSEAYDDDVGNDYFDDNFHPISGDGSNNLVDPLHPTGSDQPSSYNGDKDETRKSLNVNAASPAKVLPSSKSTKKVEKLTFERNAETGKFRCNICSSEFATKLTLKTHYDSRHLKIKHKCKLCGKEFTDLSNYTKHHKSVHVGVRFKCNLCGKCFTQKHSLISHQKSAHLGKRF